MKVHETKRVIELTERNLRVLLAKLHGHPADSACTIYKEGWSVRAVPNEKHYTDRPAGTMHHKTEAAL